MSRAVMAEKATHAGERAREMLDNSGSVVSRARSLVSGDAQFFTSQPKVDQIRKDLESDSIQEKKDAMKRVIAQICKGNDMSILFADVVKNVLIQSIELRKLIYYFIVHYAEDRPNEALLAISAFQKDLVDPSMHVRSLALRMLSSIRIPAIHPVVMLAVKKSCSDMSPIVRKTAAISLSQIHSVTNGEESIDVMTDLIGQLIGDRSPEVQGAAALSMMEICPNRMDLIHRHFRKLCRSMVEADPWAQTVIMHILLRYARTQFLDPNVKREKKKDSKEDEKKSGEEDDSDTDSSDDEKERRYRNRSELQQDLQMDSDHRLLLAAVKPLLLSMNRAVVIGAASLYFHVAPVSEFDFCVKPLLRLLGESLEGHAVVLSAIHTFVLSRPEPFIPHVKEFFVNAEDNIHVRELKIRIMSKLATPNNFTAVVHEFRSYLRSFDIQKVVAAIRGLSLVACSVADSATPIMRLVTPMLSHKNADVVTESVVVLRQLVVQGTNDKTHTCRIVHKLLQQVMAGEIKSATARASIVWLVGENIPVHTVIATAAPDCFRSFVRTFTQEDPQVKKQVLMLGSKIWLHLDGEGQLADRFKKMFFYVLELVKFDNDYDVRDRGRIVECALDRASTSFASLKTAILAPKPLPQQNDPFLEKAKYQLGSLSHLIGNALLGYQELPPWPETQPDPTTRDPPQEVRSVSPSTQSSYSSSDYNESEPSSSDESSDEASSSEAASSSDSDASSSSASSSDSSSPKTRKVVATKKIAAKPAAAVVAVKKAVVIARVVTTGAKPLPKPAVATAVAPVVAAPPKAEESVKEVSEPVEADEPTNEEPPAAAAAAAAAGDSDSDHDKKEDVEAADDEDDN
jgi:AP-3 complex subunit beta